MTLPSQLMFLPGALGRTALWEPVAGLLTHGATKVHVGWPGFGATAADPSIRGIDVAGLGGQDWRPAFHDTNPSLPRWFSTYQEDLSAQLPSVQIPALLIWGDDDPISPVGVGERLASLLPRAQLQVVAGGDHNLAETHAPLLAPLIDAHFLL